MTYGRRNRERGNEPNNPPPSHPFYWRPFLPLTYVKQHPSSPLILSSECRIWQLKTNWVGLNLMSCPISGLCFWSFQTVIPPLLHAWLILQIFQIYSCFFKIYQYLIRFEISSIFLSVFVVLKSALLPVLTCWVHLRRVISGLFSRLPPFNLHWLKSPEITHLRYIKTIFAPFIFLLFQFQKMWIWHIQ